ncbi:MAG TPA: serine/threonine-protein kinase [Candidatus Polarisedimenticolaceae bacterium]|nr:serine/threonine-protein kinase [Candidatus Polarisedimenticolaceae bacterium]
MGMSGERIGRYVRLDPIGRGAMGVVYRAEDPLIHRTVAIKVLHPARGLAPDQAYIIRERFRREAQAAGCIDHPHIVRIFDVGEDEASGEPFIVMEYLAGGSLDERIAEGSLGVDLSLAIIGQIASALDAAHERDLVHRDVKPSNILFTERGAAKIVDFGITQIASSSLTQDLAQLGTPAYMSPEQVAGRPLDARADLFSLGILSYEILTGTKPFTGGDVVAIAHAIAHNDPIPISKANPQLPASLDRIFGLMLSKEPADRFASGTAFHEALVRCLGEREARLTPRASQKRTSLWPLTAAMLLAGVAFFAWHAGRGGSAEPPAAPAAKTVPAPPAPVAAKPKTPSPTPPPAPAPKRAAPKAPVGTSETTISFTHRIREGRLVVVLDGTRILNEAFTKSRLTVSQTTVWDPVKVAAGTHSVRAQVVGHDGATYTSDACTIDFPKSASTAIRIKMKGDKLLVQPS